MVIKNYTTQIKVEKTISEIEKILAEAGSNSIFKMYDENKLPSAIAFRLWIPDIGENGQEVSFKLPMEADKILILLKKQKITPKLQTIEQAHRVGWRIIKDWLHSQMALIEIKLVKPQEVFLPYMYDEKSNQTLFQKLEKQDFNLQLEDKR